MNIIAICGSPRKGNTEYTLKRFLTRAEELGHRVELVLLREKRIGYCAGCDICVKEKKPCPIVDDARIIMERMVVNDLIVFGRSFSTGSIRSMATRSLRERKRSQSSSATKSIR
jgi:multimeric flavodoxin WrbA